VRERITGLTDDAMVPQIRQRTGAGIDERAAKLRREVRELSVLLNDVAMHAPRASINRTLKFRDDMASETGRQAAAALAKRAWAVADNVAS